MYINTNAKSSRAFILLDVFYQVIVISYRCVCWFRVSLVVAWKFYERLKATTNKTFKVANEN